MSGGQESTHKNTVSISKENRIFVTLSGKQTTRAVRQSLEEVRESIATLKKQAVKNIYVIVDITEVKAARANAAGQIELNALKELPIDAMVIVGSRFFSAMTLSILHFAHSTLRLKYVGNRQSAEEWLDSLTDHVAPRSRASIVTGVIMLLLGTSTLVGWYFGIPLLQNVFLELRPTNPLEAIGLIAIGYGFICYWTRNYLHLRATSLFGMTLGILALLPIRGYDSLLFAAQVNRIGDFALFSDSAAVCFIAMGIIGLVAARPQKWVPYVEYSASLVMGSLAFFNLYGQLYAYDFIYSISSTFVMSFNTALAFVCATLAGIFLIIYKKNGNILINISNLSWTILLVLVVVQVIGYAAWSEAANRNEHDALITFENQVKTLKSTIETETESYIDILSGYRGLFAASNTVSIDDFDNYYAALSHRDLPGLRSIALISRVDDASLASFVKKYNEEARKAGRPPFVLKGVSTDKHHYIVTYVAGGKSQESIGRDVSSTPGRAAIYDTAISRNTYSTSQSVTFAPTETYKEKKEGFFITVPVEIDGKATEGLVNANFNYDQYFIAIFKEDSLLKDLNIKVKAQDSEQVIFSKKQLTTDKVLNREIEIKVADTSWRLLVEAPKNYKLNEAQERLPLAIFISAQLFTVLLASVFILQNRGRNQSLKLVETATKELQHERNYVLELHKKDEAIIGGIADGLMVIDRNGKVQLINKAGRLILGMEHDTPLGVDFTKLITAFDATGHAIPQGKRPIEIALKQGKTISKTVYYVHKSGKTFPAQVNVSPIIQNEEVIGVIELFRDVTKDFELDKAKSEFVALASHQLRTPLSAVNWFGEMLLNGDAGALTPQQEEYIREIYDGNNRMIKLINDLLDVSRMDLGRLINMPTQVSIPGVIKSIHRELEQDIVQKELGFIEQVNSHIPDVYADEKLIRIIVQNLVSNAVKYTPNKGRVEVTLRMAQKSDFEYSHKKYSKDDFLVFIVKDTGYGIPKVQQDKVFQKLFRADNVRRLDVEGTGLGLYMVKEVAEEIGGEIRFESMESIGTTFFVLIPITTKKTKHKM